MYLPVASLRYAALPAAFFVPGILLGALIAAHTGAPQRTMAVLPPAAAQPAPAVAAELPPAAAPQAAASLPASTATSTPPPVPTAAAPLPPASESSTYSPNRLIIPSLGIDSPWLPLGWLPNGVTMDSPPGPQDLGWYTFTAQPGTAGNAVFAGHVDWHTGAPALFAHLDALTAGAEVDVSSSDGRLVRYHVASAEWYPLYGTPAAPIIAPTPAPSLTLITCGGDFNRSTHEYDQRLIVRAVAAPATGS